MSKVITKGNKRVIALSILNKTYYINVLYVNVIGLQHFDIKSSFENLDKSIQAEIKKYIRELVIEDQHISNQSIEIKIFKSFLPKKLQKELNILDNCQV